MNQGNGSHTHVKFPAHHVDLECNAVCDRSMGHRIFCTFGILVMDTNMQSRESQHHRSPVQGMLRMCESIIHVRSSGFAKAAAAGCACAGHAEAVDLRDDGQGAVHSQGARLQLRSTHAGRHRQHCLLEPALWPFLQNIGMKQLSIASHAGGNIFRAWKLFITL